MMLSAPAAAQQEATWSEDRLFSQHDAVYLLIYMKPLYSLGEDEEAV